MDSGDYGMNPVAMIIINPRKEYWRSRGSNTRPPLLKSATLPTELCRLGVKILECLAKDLRKVFFDKISVKKKKKMIAQLTFPQKYS